MKKEDEADLLKAITSKHDTDATVHGSDVTVAVLQRLIEQYKNGDVAIIGIVVVPFVGTPRVEIAVANSTDQKPMNSGHIFSAHEGAAQFDQILGTIGNHLFGGDDPESGN